MSWSVSGELPGLDPDRIRAACERVAAANPVTLDFRIDGPDRITASFVVDAARAREWEQRVGWYPASSPLQAQWDSYGFDGESPIPIEIEFFTVAADQWGPAFSKLTFDTGHSGNGLLPNAGQQILNAIGAELGVECKADF